MTAVLRAACRAGPSARTRASGLLSVQQCALRSSFADVWRGCADMHISSSSVRSVSSARNVHGLAWYGAQRRGCLFSSRKNNDTRGRCAFSTEQDSSSSPGGDAANASATSDAAKAYSSIVLTQQDHVAVIRMNRPKVLNAFDDESTREIVHALRACESDRSVRCIIITGTGRAFAAGANISEMVSRSMQEQSASGSGAWIDAVARIRKPLVAAVNGFALGGGCELALACDITLASVSAQFGQPEIQIGTIPGWGGTQRLIRAVGKAKAMEMVLTGRRMQADEAERAGLVARVLPDDKLMEEALAVASIIAGYSEPVVRSAKQCVNLAHEAPLSAGLVAERVAFHATFALEDQKEGMLAFLDKRTPHWRHK